MHSRRSFFYIIIYFYLLIFDSFQVLQADYTNEIKANSDNIILHHPVILLGRRV